MRKTILAALFVSITMYSYGQKSFGIKIYQNTDRFETQYTNREAGEVTKVRNLNFHRISLAVNMSTKKGYMYEIEFLIPELSKSLDNVQFPMNYEFREGYTFEGKASTFSLRYELNKMLTDKDKRFAFLLGVGINPYYVHVEYEPNVSTTYYWSTKLYGFAMNITPRIKYRLSQRFSMDLNVPIKVYDLRGRTDNVKNPALPTRQQTNTEYSNVFFESAYTIRLGLMYTLNK